MSHLRRRRRTLLGYVTSNRRRHKRLKPICHTFCADFFESRDGLVSFLGERGGKKPLSRAGGEPGRLRVTVIPTKPSNRSNIDDSHKR